MNNSTGNKSKIKKILFLTGTRADFGKIKSLMLAVEESPHFENYVFATGMHMFQQYGATVDEVIKCGFKNIFQYINQKTYDSMDTVLANTIKGLGNYLQLVSPDMIVVHGDRVEALAGAIVGALNNILVAHIEGGEVSGTIDESIRHSVSKLSHVHFVANEDAKARLIQMGESENTVYPIGSPDIDLMLSKNLPNIDEVKKYYDINFEDYGIFMYHPVTTNLHGIVENTKKITKALVESNKNYIAIYPNNDSGSEYILEELLQLENHPRFRIFPSLRFEYFLVLLKNCDFMIGNSSAGIREAPFYGIPTINIGTRQNNRFHHSTIVNTSENTEEILSAVKNLHKVKRSASNHFGQGNSTELFMDILNSKNIWNINIQKQFLDTNN